MLILKPSEHLPGFPRVIFGVEGPKSIHRSPPHLHVYDVLIAVGMEGKGEALRLLGLFFTTCIRQFANVSVATKQANVYLSLLMSAGDSWHFKYCVPRF